MKKYVILLFLIDTAFASTLCTQITQSVSHVAFGNYLSFSSGTLLTFFSKPSKDDKSFFAKLKRFVIQTAVIQLMAVLSLMTFMSVSFFELNDKTLPKFISTCSIIMYSFCGVTVLTQFIADKFRRSFIRGILFVPIYIVQMIFQVYMKFHFPSSGYMILFQWTSIFSMMFALPLTCILFYLMSKDEREYKKFIYVFIYPFVFQIYLHIGYICFYLYCDEGYLSSALLLSGSFALGNVVHSAYYLIFPQKEWDEVPDRDGDYYHDLNDINYGYKAKALHGYEVDSGNDQNELSFSRGEILDIADNKGKWWHARKVNGEVGMAPSNYLQIIPRENQEAVSTKDESSYNALNVVSINNDCGFKAKAVYDYRANLDNRNELSLSKGEILDIVDSRGEWWQARKSNGEVGRIPGNYFVPIKDESSNNTLNMASNYEFSVEAMYDFEADQDDQNELSFLKGEILEITDSRGKWWKSRNANGEVGMVPSNYLQII